MNEIKLTPNRMGKSVAMRMLAMEYIKQHPNAVVGFVSSNGIRWSKLVKQVEPLQIFYDECPSLPYNKLTVSGIILCAWVMILMTIATVMVWTN